MKTRGVLSYKSSFLHSQSESLAYILLSFSESILRSLSYQSIMFRILCFCCSGLHSVPDRMSLNPCEAEVLPDLAQVARKARMSAVRVNFWAFS